MKFNLVIYVIWDKIMDKESLLSIKKEFIKGEK